MVHGRVQDDGEGFRTAPVGDVPLQRVERGLGEAMEVLDRADAADVGAPRPFRPQAEERAHLGAVRRRQHGTCGLDEVHEVIDGGGGDQVLHVGARLRPLLDDLRDHRRSEAGPQLGGGVPPLDRLRDRARRRPSEVLHRVRVRRELRRRGLRRGAQIGHPHLARGTQQRPAVRPGEQEGLAQLARLRRLGEERQLRGPIQLALREGVELRERQSVRLTGVAPCDGGGARVGGDDVGAREPARDDRRIDRRVARGALPGQHLRRRADGGCGSDVRRGTRSGARVDPSSHGASDDTPVMDVTEARPDEPLNAGTSKVSRAEMMRTCASLQAPPRSGSASPDRPAPAGQSPMATG